MTATTLAVLRAGLEERGHVYHFHDPELIPAGLLLRVLGKRVIRDVHEDLPRQVESKHYIHPRLRRPIARAMEALEGVTGRAYSGTVTATAHIAERFPPARTAIVQNFPILGELARPSPTPLADRVPLVAYVGNLTAVRGAREMVDAIGLVRPELRACLAIGGAFEPPALQVECEAKPGWQSVDYRGWLSRDGVACLLAQARVGLVVLHPEPNYVEGQPIKLYEYMSAGIPVVASDFPLWRKVVEESGCGLLVDPLDPAAMARAIEWLLDHPAESEEMGRRGVEAVQSRFNWQNESRSLLALYERVLEAR
jgi:glycosyltransferase involved in cell wall biosynthesis